MNTGTVKWFSAPKGYGFITAEDGTDVFVHYTGIKGEGEGFKTLVENQKVSYDVETDEKGRSVARNVEVIA